MKGDFQAVRKELGPQLKELQSFVQKDGPEAVNRLLSKVKNTKPAAGGSSDDAARRVVIIIIIIIIANTYTYRLKL